MERVRLEAYDVSCSIITGHGSLYSLYQHHTCHQLYPSLTHVTTTKVSLITKQPRHHHTHTSPYHQSNSAPSPHSLTHITNTPHPLSSPHLTLLLYIPTDLFQGLLEGLEIIHPLHSKPSIHHIRLVEGYHKRQLCLVQDTGRYVCVCVCVCQSPCVGLCLCGCDDRVCVCVCVSMYLQA